MNVFALGIDAVFGDPNIAVYARWRQGGAGEGVSIRVILTSPDRIVRFGGSRAVMASEMLDVRASDIASPAKDDTFQIGSRVLTVLANPVADTLRLVWSCEVAEA